jgi:ribosome-binding factor A
MSSLRLPGSSGRKRPLRIAAEILRDLPEILRANVELPGGILLTITDVEVNDDLSFARVFFSVVGGVEEQTALAVAELLNSRKGVIRHEIAQRLVMRQHPDLRFVHDPTPARVARIEELLRQARDSSLGKGGSDE